MLVGTFFAPKGGGTCATRVVYSKFGDATRGRFVVESFAHSLSTGFPRAQCLMKAQESD